MGESFFLGRSHVVGEVGFRVQVRVRVVHIHVNMS